MAHSHCYAATIKDKDLADILKTESPNSTLYAQDIAFLRGLYDDYNESISSETYIPLESRNDLTDQQKALELLEFRKNLILKERALLHPTAAEFSQQFLNLKRSMTAENLEDCISFVVTMFSKIVDRQQKLYQEKFPGDTITRLDVVNGGKTSKGIAYGGEDVIFKILREQTYKLYSSYSALALKNTQDEEAKIYKHNYKVFLENFPAIVTMARKQIKDTESLKLSHKRKIATEIDESSYGENDLTVIFNPEEATRESWQETNELKSSFGSLGSEVRKLLSTIPADRGITGFLKNKRYLDPQSAHRELIELFRGCINSSDVLEKLTNSTVSWQVELGSILSKNPKLLTQMYVDTKKNFLLYSIMYRDTSYTGVGTKYNTKILNKISNNALTQLLTSIRFKRKIPFSIFSGDSVDISMAKDLVKSINTLVDATEAGKACLLLQRASKQKNIDTLSAQITNLIVIADRLGYSCSMETATRLLNDSKIKRKLRTDLIELRDRVLSTVIKDDSNKFSGRYGITNLLNLKNSSQKNAKKGLFEEKLQKIFSHYSKFDDSTAYESYALYKDSHGNSITMYSNVIPCFMGDVFDHIESYAKTHQGGLSLKAYLESIYKKNSAFYDSQNGGWLNSWIENLINSVDSKGDVTDGSFADIFQMKRLLGEGLATGINFEKFSSQKHTINMLLEYFSDRQISENSKTANYPVFVLGDSGVCKYIKAFRYDANTSEGREELIKQYEKVFQSEKNRMAIAKAMEESCLNQGIKPPKTFVENKDKFTLLSFLNEDKYKNILNTQGFREALNTFMEDRIGRYEANGAKPSTLNDENTLIGQFNSLELFEKAEQGDGFKHFNFLSKASVDQMATDFFWNVKLATIQQLQMFTIDTSFYKSTKDLQKRYKEQHAPGSILDIHAKFFNTKTGQYEYYSRTTEDGRVNPVEKVVYFNEVQLNTEKFNPEFMEAILKNYSKNNELLNRYDIKDLITPRENEQEEANRNAILKDILKENYRIYNSYREVDSTDGQGYRSLTAYRRVMGMAGKWTDSMENYYQKIISLREVYTQNGLEIPEALLEELHKNSNIILQPIKSYLFGFENYTLNNQDENANALIPVQHKYAEIVLIPELCEKGSALQQLGYFLENNDIDMACSTSVVKSGEYAAVPVSQLLEVDYSTPENESKLINITHNLSYQDYRIQTNVPNHMDCTRLFGTQLRKLIMANINKKDNHYTTYIGNKKVNLGFKDATGLPKMSTLTGENLVYFYNSLIVANILEDFKALELSLDTKDQISEILIQSALSNDRISAESLMAYSLTQEGDFLLPLFEPFLGHDSASLLLSQFKQKVNQQKIKGGSAVQASSFGSQMVADELDENSGGLKIITNDTNTNTLVMECSMSFNFEIGGKKLAYDDYVNSDGTLKISRVKQRLLDIQEERKRINDEVIPQEIKMWEDFFSTFNVTENDYKNNFLGIKVSNSDASAFLEKYNIHVPSEFKNDGMVNLEDVKLAINNAFNSNDLLNSLDLEEDALNMKNHEEYLLDEDYPGLRNFIAYRIPSERPYSVLNLIAVRFTRPELGGVIKVPAQCTKIAGFDFDIDKLYFILKEFKIDHEKSYADLSEQEKEKIWNQVWNMYPKIKDTLKSYKEAISGKEHLNFYWDECIQDFDKDKIFEQAANTLGYTLNEKVYQEYDLSKQAIDNTRTSRNNMLLHLIQQRLQDPETFKARTTPGGFENAKFAARCFGRLFSGDIQEFSKNGNVDIEKLQKLASGDKEVLEPNYDPTDPMTNIIYNQQNQVAMKLIGIFANQNANFAFSTLLQEFRLKQGFEISFCGHTYSDLLHNPDGRDVELLMAEFLASSVDAIKDPVLKFLNFGLLTADTGAFLARLGFNTFEIGLLFNQPIIKRVCEYAENNNCGLDTAIAKIKEEYSLAFCEDGYQYDNELSKQYGGELDVQTLANAIIQKRENPSIDKTSIEFAYQQAAALDLFMKANNIANEIGTFINASKMTAANSVGSSFGDVYYKLQKIQKDMEKYEVKSRQSETGESNENALSFVMKVTPFQESPLIVDENFLNLIQNDPINYQKLISRNPFGYEQCMYDCYRSFLMKMTDKYFPYEKPLYKQMRNELQKISFYETPSKQLIDALHNSIPQFLLANTENSTYNGEEFCDFEFVGNDNLITNREFFTSAELLKALFEFFDSPNNTQSSKYAFGNFRSQLVLEEKTRNETKRGTTTKYTKYYIKYKSINGSLTAQKDAFTSAWFDMYNTDVPISKTSPHTAAIYKYIKKKNGEEITFKDIAMLFYFYSYYNQGNLFSPIGIGQYIPTLMKADIPVQNSAHSLSYGKWLSSFMTDANLMGVRDDADAMMQMFIRNNLHDYQLVYTVPRDLPNAKNGLQASLKNHMSTVNGKKVITINVKEKEFSTLFKVAGYFDKERTKTIYACRPCIKIGEKYYICNNQRTTDEFGFNCTDIEGNITLVETTPLGAKGISTQYLASSSALEDVLIPEFINDSMQSTTDAQKSQDEEESNNNSLSPAVEPESNVNPEALKIEMVNNMTSEDIRNILGKALTDFFNAKFKDKNIVYTVTDIKRGLLSSHSDEELREKLKNAADPKNPTIFMDKGGITNYMCK